MTSYLYRMPAGIAGAISRPHDLTTEPVILSPSKQFAEYGLPGKFDGDAFVPLTSADTAASIVGFLVRPYPTTSAADFARQVNTGGVQQGDALKRGYMTVNIAGDATAIVKNSQVYCALAGGAITATAPAEGDKTIVAIPNAVFTGAGDADGNTEISYKI